MNLHSMLCDWNQKDLFFFFFLKDDNKVNKIRFEWLEIWKAKKATSQQIFDNVTTKQRRQRYIRRFFFGEGRVGRRRRGLIKKNMKKKKGEIKYDKEGHLFFRI